MLFIGVTILRVLYCIIIVYDWAIRLHFTRCIVCADAADVYDDRDVEKDVTTHDRFYSVDINRRKRAKSPYTSQVISSSIKKEYHHSDKKLARILHIFIVTGSALYFNLTLGTRDYVITCNFWVESVQCRVPPNRGNVTLLWLFLLSCIFYLVTCQGRTVAPIFTLNDSNDVFPPKDSPFWGQDDRWRHMGEKCAPKTPQEGAWIGSFKPKRQNLYVTISLELFIRRTSDLRTEFRPWITLRGWSAITPKQIQHDWLPPSWKWNMTSFHTGWSDLDEIRHHDAEMVEIETWSRISIWQTFMFLKTGSSYISAVNWDMSTKFVLLIDFDLLKAVTLTNTKLNWK